MSSQQSAGKIRPTIQIVIADDLQVCFWAETFK